MSVFVVVAVLGLVVTNYVEGGGAWIHRSLASLSQAINVWVFRGQMGESLSSRCYREEREVLRAMIDLAFWMFLREEHHCWNTYLNDYQRAVETQELFRQRYPDWRNE